MIMKMLQKNLEKFLKHMKYYQIVKKEKNIIKKGKRQILNPIKKKIEILVSIKILSVIFHLCRMI